MIQYGDEIGIGDDLRLPEREAARTPMQWTSELHGGFSRAKTVVRPVIGRGPYGYRRLNVAAQRRDPDSLLVLTERMLRARRECQEISWGSFRILRTNAAAVLAIRYEWRGTSLVTLHNFSDRTQTVRLTADAAGSRRLVDVFHDQASHARGDGEHHLTLRPYGWTWLRVGSADNTLDLEELNLTDGQVQ